MVARPVGGLLADRVGRRATLTGTLAVAVVLLVALAAVRAVWLVVLVVLVLGLVGDAGPELARPDRGGDASWPDRDRGP